ncbi:MAG: hypothetical protein QOG45_668, partial [Chloroflexota bacterium]|nr:hypothetical protein [Chloroflexota bacterium]
ARAGLMRLLGWAWDGRAVISVHGDRELLGEVGVLAAALLPLVESGAAAVQLAAPGRLGGEEEFAAALEAALGGRCRRLPAEAQLEDQVAVLRCSAAFLGPEGFGLQVARALRLRSAALPLAEPGAAVLRLLDPQTPRPAPPREAIARLDGYLDRLAGLALVAAARRAAAGPGVAATLPEAHRALGLRLFAERRALQEALDGEVRRLEAELGAARAESDRLRAELGASRAANDAIVGSRTWRYSQPVRDTLARVRERRR